jgi:hypothetical protein
MGFLINLVKTLWLFIPDNGGFQRLPFARFSQELVKDKKLRGWKEVGDEGFEPATNRLRVTTSKISSI